MVKISPSLLPLSEAGAISRALLDWYDRHGRTLPWRVPHGEHADPYRVWLSEVMLQQTTVAAVKGYFAAFIRSWPTVEALAQAPLDDVLRAWAGLGYYARARNLHKCARIVAKEHGGRFPDTAAALKTLPGIGDYTAAAIAAIAFDRPEAAVDGNVERVIARLGAVNTPLPAAKSELRMHAAALVPEQRPGDYAQALMDLGATVCTPRRTDCVRCPLAPWCEARKLGIANDLPRRTPKARRPTRKGVCFWVERDDGAILLRRRPESGLLGGMFEVPSSDWVSDGETDRPERTPESAAPVTARWRVLPGAVQHTFSHFHLVLEIWRCVDRTGAWPHGKDDYLWVSRDDLGRAALPSVMRKVCAHALGADQCP